VTLVTQRLSDDQRGQQGGWEVVEHPLEPGRELAACGARKPGFAP
jgi:hypothetical protein